MEKQRVLPLKSSFKCHLLEEGFANEAVKEEMLQQSSSFNIDVNPRLMLSSEQLVEILITSGVGRYLEFAAIERTYVHFQPSALGVKHPEEGACFDTVWDVPCSKKDVFQSKLLGMVEKRQLMKFLQFVADYGETHILHEDVTTKNERTLALGRALKRPQNKASQTDEDAEIAAYLDRPFQELLEKHFKLSTKLQQVVVYCVGLASFPAAKNQISARDGLAAVYRYVASIGRFTGTAFLAPLYGISELAQSFCRLSAVYGGLYVLCASVDRFVLDTEKGEVSGVHCSDGGVLRAKHIVTSGSYVDCFRLTDDEEKTERAHGRTLRGVFVLKASLREGMARIIIVIPPEDTEFKNPFAVQVVQLDVGSYACPKGYFLAHVSMPLPAEWFDQTVKQRELLRSVIRRLILSSETDLQQKHGKQTKADAKATLHEAPTNTLEEMTASDVEEVEAPDITTNPPSKPAWSDRIAWRAMFSTDHLVSGGTCDISASTKRRDLPTNVWVCETCMSEPDDKLDPVDLLNTPDDGASPLEIHLESVTANARAIFEALCPGEPFLPKSASAEQAEQEEQDSEEDAVLRAAQKLAQQTKLNDEPFSTCVADTLESEGNANRELRTKDEEVGKVNKLNTIDSREES
uniref:Rab proteins geranylgeranyltransferase component n=1 Tax=Hyaloperonospora arabidopsidis (strain Emoy2) TaxID=559515 RepID=M4B8X5_HYAAE